MALRVSSITETDTSSKSDSKSKEHSQSQSRSDSQSTTKKLLDSDLMNQILGGLVRNMTDEEINQFAENLLRPQLNAALEESQQNYETTKLSKEQELENLAASLTRAIDEQNTAYRKKRRERRNGGAQPRHGQKQLHAANAGQPGRRAGQGGAAADGREHAAERADSAADHAGGAAEQPDAGTTEHGLCQPACGEGAGIERKPAQGMEQQLPDGDSAAMGQQTTGSQQTSGTTDTTGEQHTEGSSHSTSVTYTNRGGGGKKNKSGDIDAVTSAAPSAKRR